jgi:ParB family chromosome partitioning protein
MSKTLPKLPGRAKPAGRGAGAMFGELASSGRLRTVALSAIAPNPRQPRRRFDEDELAALAESIRERGVLQPPVVRDLGAGSFELIAGERRWRAARIAELAELEVLVKDTDDAGALEDAVLENTARVDLSPIELARVYATMVEDLEITQGEIGRRVGCSRASIANHMRLLDLPDEAIELVDGGVLSFAHGRALLLCDDHATRRQLARQAVAEGWSTRQLEEHARGAGAPRRRRAARGASSDQRAFAESLGESVSRASGLEVRVQASAGERFTFVVQGVEAARAFADGWGGER